MSEREEQVISTESEPVVEIVEEVQPDGSIIRKKKTTRKITKRVLTTGSSTLVSSSTNESEHASASTTTLEESKHEISAAAAAATTDTTTTDTTTATATTSTTNTDNAVDLSIDAEQPPSSTGRSFKYRFFGEGDSSNHPFYKYLAKFPLKQSPAPHTRSRPIKAILYAYAPGWHVGQESSLESEKSPVGSFDVESLKWMSYLKFNNIEFELKPAFEPGMSPSGKLPFLALPNGSFVTADGFESWVQDNKSQSAASKLDLQEAAEAVAFIALAESKIHAALLYTLWFEPSHFHTTTRQHYFGHYHWILTKVLSYMEKSNVASSMLLTRTQIDRELIFEEAATAIEALAVQLGDKDYFFGKSEPSGLDAVVFPYLHVILTLPRIRNAEDAGRSGELTRIVRKHENLFKYSQNIWKRWFAA
ncbi:hypothetical protein BGZ98_000829 [Dissophora globulifera]|nr:hypothetical protein BGZ98_000829 [Dissophora globulifera]